MLSAEKLDKFWVPTTYVEYNGNAPSRLKVAEVQLNPGDTTFASVFRPGDIIPNKVENPTLRNLQFSADGKWKSMPTSEEKDQAKYLREYLLYTGGFASAVGLVFVASSRRKTKAV